MNGFEKVMTDLLYYMLLLHDRVNLTFVSIVLIIPERKLILIGNHSMMIEAFLVSRDIFLDKGHDTVVKAFQTFSRQVII